MRIALATGKKALNMVKEAVKDAHFDNHIKCDVLMQDIEIAAFSTPKSLKFALKEKDFPSYDLILVSGICSADFTSLQEEIATPIRLGPKHAYDLVDVLPLIKEEERGGIGVEFSSRIPADELIKIKRKERAKILLQNIEDKISGKFKIKNLKIGGGTRMKVCAEIVDATRMRKEEYQQKMKYFMDSGADIIDIGVPLDAKEKEVEKTVKAALSYANDIPLSIDTMDANLILAAINAGVDMVLSLNGRIIEEIGEEVGKKDVAAVIIPDFKHKSEKNLNSIFNTIKKATEVGIAKIIADSLLNAVGYGIATSLHNYYAFRLKDKKTPLFFGIGNVTELMDADSVGINAVLAGIASELDASILFTTEHSDKTKGCVRELRTASEMMMLSKLRKSAPKDIGINLLQLKEKREKGYSELERSDKKIVDVTGEEKKEKHEWNIDPSGSFRIGICEIGRAKNRRIYAEHFPTGEIIIGKKAKEIMDEIIRRKGVSFLEHASYLSRELTKAELALKLSRSYVQDEEIFYPFF